MITSFIYYVTHLLTVPSHNAMFTQVSRVDVQPSHLWMAISNLFPHICAESYPMQSEQSISTTTIHLGLCILYHLCPCVNVFEAFKLKAFVQHHISLFLIQSWFGSCYVTLCIYAFIIFMSSCYVPFHISGDDRQHVLLQHFQHCCLSSYIISVNNDK